MIIRVNKNKDYTVMNNHHLRDKDLSLKAKGLLSVVMSLPEEWDYSIAGLVSICKESESSVKSTLEELKQFGYLVITKKLPNETETGRYQYIYDFYEEPEKQEGKKQEVENQPLEIQPLEIQPLENHPLNKDTNKLSTDKSNTKELNKDNGKERKMSYDEILDQVPVIVNNPDLRESFIDFIKMRKFIKAPLTDKGLKMAINEAYKLGHGDADLMKKLVDQSTMNSWKGIFPLKQDDQERGSTPDSNPFTEYKKQKGWI